jgi:bifunctional DNA-binding transcriptional regulator/antitoxin component of YhaV-PrlF toxin-antitoxin module
MRLTIIGRRGHSYQTTIPPEILRALGARAGDHISWTWNTNGHVEIRRLLHPHEIAALRLTPTKPLKPRRRRRET